jgi:flagellar hook-length control protein FliK
MAVMESAMSVVPDLLLQPAAKTKARMVPNKTPAATPQASQRKSEFAQVYARERQDKVAERAEPVAKPARDKSADANVTKADSATASADAEGFAASGKTLPANADAATSADNTEVAAAKEDEEGPPQAQLDPLMMLALTGQLPAETSVTPAALSGVAVSEQAEGELTGQGPLMPGVAGAAAVSAGVAAMTDASHDSTLDTLTSAAGVQLVVDLAAKAQLAAQTATQQGVAGQGATNTAQDFAGALAGATQLLPTNPEAKLGEAALAALNELGVEGAEGLKDASPELRSENLSGRLSALSQAVSQQTPAASRLSLLPGQPLALQQSGWSESVVDKVMWLSSQNLKSAEIQLEPADLGRLEVRVDMTKDQTQVTFASPHAGVRETLEGQMQRLRDLFTAQGMHLADVNVSDQSLSRGWQGQEQNNGGGAHRGGRSDGALGAGDEQQIMAVTELRGKSSLSPRGLVDYYA